MPRSKGASQPSGAPKKGALSASRKGGASALAPPPQLIRKGGAPLPPPPVHSPKTPPTSRQAPSPARRKSATSVPSSPSTLLKGGSKRAEARRRKTMVVARRASLADGGRTSAFVPVAEHQEYYTHKAALTVLFTAIRAGDGSRVEVALEGGAGVNTAMANDGFTPLMAAAWWGHPDVVRLLLESGASHTERRTKFGGHNALHDAAAQGHVDCARVLCNRGADPRLAAHDGSLPIHSAAANDSVEAVAYLAQLAPDTIHTPATNGAGPAHLCALRGANASLLALLEASESSHRTVNTPSTTSGQTPISIAAQEGHESTVDLLASYGANVHTACRAGATPIFMAAQNGEEATIRLCASLGCNVDVGTTAGGTTFYSPIKIAAANGHLGAVKTLIQLGSQVEAAEYMAELDEIDREEIEAWTMDRLTLGAEDEERTSEQLEVEPGDGVGDGDGSAAVADGVAKGGHGARNAEGAGPGMGKGMGRAGIPAPVGRRSSKQPVGGAARPKGIELDRELDSKSSPATQKAYVKSQSVERLTSPRTRR